MNKSLFLHCLKITSPVFFGYITIGIGFGILFVDAGYPWWLTPVSSLFMFTGAGQYFAVALFAGGATLGEILLVEFLLRFLVRTLLCGRKFAHALDVDALYSATNFYCFVYCH